MPSSVRSIRALSPDQSSHELGSSWVPTDDRRHGHSGTVVDDPVGRPVSRRVRTTAFVLSGLSFILVIAQSNVGWAESVTVNGTVGLAGADGAASEDGGAGGAGGDALATSGPLDTSNTSTANGGDGGSGGRGGTPNGNGGDGGHGGAAQADSSSTPTTGSANSTSRAFGGDGGAGGLAAGAGTGGAGGDGAVAIANSNSLTTSAVGGANAESTGGNGGAASGAGSRGGNAGSGTSNARATGTFLTGATARVTGGSGGVGWVGADGGRGGDAVVDSVATSVSTVVATGELNRTHIAKGGVGGSSEGGIAGNGGFAQATAAHSITTASAIKLSIESTGGAGGGASAGGFAGAGGNAHSEAIATQLGKVTLNATSTGGMGGSITAGTGDGNAGGSATSHSVGTSTQAGLETVASASATGGTGGTGRGVGHRAGDGGAADATALGVAPASGTGTTFGTVTVQGGRGGQAYDGADGGNGADVSLNNSVQGQGVIVSLTQQAFGGAAGLSSTSGPVTGRSGRGGAATSDLDAHNPNGRLVLRSFATGGSGDTSDGIAGTASASALGTASGDVSIFTLAEGGDGTGASDGASAFLEPTRGVSTNGGDVVVEARVTGGSGGTDGVDVGDGADASAHDAIDGQTTGRLTLRQYANGGDGGRIFPSTATGIGGRGGNATSELDVVKSAGSLAVTVEATAGKSNALTSSGTQQVGGAARAATDSRNDGGDLDVAYKALGGNGSERVTNGGSAGAGGDATSQIRATTSGDGNDVAIGIGTTAVGLFKASTVGGDGGVADGFNRVGVGGTGGRAFSDVVGAALGDSAVNVAAVATGGRGGRGGRSGSGAGGVGGAAETRAEGLNNGSAAVDVLADSIGGVGGTSPVTAGAGGAAVATAYGESTGGGDVTTTARATGGASTVAMGTAQADSFARTSGMRATSPPSITRSGISHAESRAVGARGLANASAEAPVYESDRATFAIGAATRSDSPVSARSEARAGGSALGVFSSTADAASFTDGLAGSSGEWGHAGLQVRTNQSGPDIVLDASSRIRSDSVSIASLDGVFVSFLDIQIQAVDATGVSFRIENEGALLIDQTFTDTADILAFFSGVLDLGQFDDSIDVSRIDLEFTLTMSGNPQSARLGTYFAVGSANVPEPGTGSLLILGLVVLSLRRPRRSRSWERPDQ